VNREPSLDELIGADVTGAERERLQKVHELLLQAGRPPELAPELLRPNLAMTLGARRKSARPRVLMLLAGALAVVIVFLAGYVVANHGGGSATPRVVRALVLHGTSAAPNAQATLQIRQSENGNWPMTLSVAGLPKLPAANEYYEVYLVRDGRPWGSCGTFRVTSSTGGVTVTLNAPYSLRPGDSWIVTLPAPSGSEPGKTVLRPVTT
jgi:hypothetical protein